MQSGSFNRLALRKYFIAFKFLSNRDSDLSILCHKSIHYNVCHVMSADTRALHVMSSLFGQLFKPFVFFPVSNFHIDIEQ